MHVKLIAIVLLFTGCNTLNAINPFSAGGQGTKIADVRGEAPGIKTVTKRISKEEYWTAFRAGSGANRARLLRIFDQKAGSDLPEYRLFDIRKKSVFEMLGLRPGDVLVAAGGYVIPNPQIFWDYLSILPQDPEAQIEIRRSGQALALKYEFY